MTIVVTNAIKSICNPYLLSPDADSINAKGSEKGVSSNPQYPHLARLHLGRTLIGNTHRITEMYFFTRKGDAVHESLLVTIQNLSKEYPYIEMITAPYSSNENYLIHSWREKFN